MNELDNPFVKTSDHMKLFNLYESFYELTSEALRRKLGGDIEIKNGIHTNRVANMDYVEKMTDEALLYHIGYCGKLIQTRRRKMRRNGDHRFEKTGWFNAFRRCF